MDYNQLLQNFISQKRIDHSFRVQDVAMKLSEHYGADTKNVAVAAILHDIAKEQTPESYKAMGLNASLFDSIWQQYPATWHAFAGPLLIEKECPGQSQSIADMVAHHTTGKANMSLETSIIFVADFIEPGRKGQLNKEVSLAAFKDLNKAIGMIAAATLEKLKTRKLPIHPLSFECYNYYINE